MKTILLFTFLLPMIVFGQMTQSSEDSEGNVTEKKYFPNGYVFFKFDDEFCRLSVEYDVMDSNHDADFTEDYDIFETPTLTWLSENYAIRIFVKPNKGGLERIYLTKIDQSCSVHLFYNDNSRVSFSGTEVWWYM